ncbi:MAG: FCD domain-containing protein [Veillonella sp.]
MVPRRGTYVANISLKDITQVFEIRSALEELAAGLAAGRITEEEIETLETNARRDRRPYGEQKYGVRCGSGRRIP